MHDTHGVVVLRSPSARPRGAAADDSARAGLAVLTGLTAAVGLRRIALAPKRRGGLPLMIRRGGPGARPSERLLLVDGNNLMGQRKVTKGRDALAAKLAGMNVGRCVLVFDGKAGEAAKTRGTDPVIVVTKGGDEFRTGRVTADEWIEKEIETASYERVEVVTADRRLRATCHSLRAKTINPKKFWRRYLARLKGLKTDYTNVPKEELP